MSRTSIIDEKTLILRLKAGDESAVEEWYSAYAPKMLRYLRTNISNESDCEEVRNDIFISCFESITLFQGQSSLWTWMCSIARHEIADYFRKKYAKRAIKCLPFGDTLLPSSLLDSSELQESVVETLKRMTNKDREILLAKYVDKKSVSSLARAFGVSLKSMESSLFRARNAFRALYLIVEKEQETA